MTKAISTKNENPLSKSAWQYNKQKNLKVNSHFAPNVAVRLKANIYCFCDSASLHDSTSSSVKWGSKYLHHRMSSAQNVIEV